MVRFGGGIPSDILERASVKMTNHQMMTMPLSD